MVESKQRIPAFVKHFFIPFLLWSLSANASVADTSPGLKAPNLHSLQVFPELNPLAPPVITLGGNDRILIKWDEMGDDMRYMRYELIHCDADWRPSRLLTSEYLDGFNEGRIDDYAYSRLSENHYTHYSLRIPNAEMQPKVSGNYLVRIYDEEDPDNTLLQARFYVVEPLADISATVSSRTDVDVNESHQQLSVAVDTKRLQGITDPFSELTLQIEQNGRQDNSIEVRRPLKINDRTAIYEHLPALIFPAGNEYRRFETVTPRYPGMGVDKIRWINPFYHYQLYVDVPRDRELYVYDQTQQGRFTPRNSDGTDGDTDADYGIVHFSLDIPERVDADIYIDGDLTNRKFSPESRMTFNRETNRYEASLLLKQGSYNYQYLAVPKGTTVGHTADIEGNKFETVNEYSIRVYHRPPGARADRLIGATAIYSGK